MTAQDQDDDARLEALVEALAEKIAQETGLPVSSIKDNIWKAMHDTMTRRRA